MLVTYNERQNTYNVIITDADLKEAFASESGYLAFLHNIVLTTYGKDLADQLFPIEKGETNHD